MRDEIVDPTELLQAEFERQLAQLREELVAAGTRRERSKVRRDIRRLRRHIFNRQVASW
jgi:hypothetical protein